jgi:molybdopterin adenylyltransferase
LSRAIAGTRGTTLIVNSPGSPKGTVETVTAVIDVIPHAVRLMAAAPTDH